MCVSLDEKKLGGVEMSESVKILRELTRVKEDRVYFHDLDLNKGISSTLGKVTNVSNLLVLADRVPEGLKREDLKVLEKVLRTLQQGRTRVMFKKTEITTIFILGTRIPVLRNIDTLMVHLRGINQLDELELLRWESVLEEEIERLSGLEDITGSLKKIVVDDGLNELVLIQNLDEVVGEVKEGDVIEVTLKENRYKSELGYVVAVYDQELKYEIEKIKILEGVV